MSKDDPTIRTVVRFPASIRGQMQEQAIAAGFQDGRGPGLSKYLIHLHEENVKATEEAESMLDDPITFESMTPGEQWYAMRDVFWLAEFDSDREQEIFTEWSKLDNANITGIERSSPPLAGEPMEPLRQARYDAALAYVKGVIDGQ